MYASLDAAYGSVNWLAILNHGPPCRTVGPRLSAAPVLRDLQYSMMYELTFGITAAYLLIGFIAGGTAGLLGLGGGIVIVPALLFLFLQDDRILDAPLMQWSIATSLAAIVFIAGAACWGHHRRGTVRWPVVKVLFPGIVIGSVLGALIADRLPSRMLQSIFAVFQILVAVRILLYVPKPVRRRLPGVGKMIFSGGIIGTVSAMLGIGGGTLTVPFLLWCKFGMRHAVGTASACGIPIALIGSIVLAGAGWRADLPQPALGYIYLPAVAFIVVGSLLGSRTGVRLAYCLPVSVLRRIFAIVLLLVGLKMLI